MSLSCSDCEKEFGLSCGPDGCDSVAIDVPFKKLMRKYHPDKGKAVGKEEEYLEKAQLIVNCRELLKSRRCARNKSRTTARARQPSESRNLDEDEYTQDMLNDLEVSLGIYGVAQSALLEHNWRLKRPLEEGQKNLADAMTAMLGSLHEQHRLQTMGGDSRKLRRVQRDTHEMAEYLQTLAANYRKAKAKK